MVWNGTSAEGGLRCRDMASHLNPSEEALALLRHARAATPFRSPAGEPCASLPASLDSRNVVSLRSAEFRDWLTRNFKSEHESPPSAAAIAAVLRTLESDAKYGEFPDQKVDLRVGFEGDPYFPSRILLDLANDSGNLLEITAQGFSTTNNLKHAFRQSLTMLPLPLDVAASAEAKRDAMDLFARLFSLNEIARARALGWLVAALRPTGPYPILVLRGPAGSGKSVLGRALRALVDPSSAPVRRIPVRDRDVARVAYDNWVVTFNHVQRLPPNICAALASIVTGDAFDIRQPDRREAASVELARPVILIAPSDGTSRDWTVPRSLSNRTVTIDLEVISTPLPEARVVTAFAALRPALIAVLASAVSTALARLREVETGPVRRLADCAAWAAAAAPALGLAETDIVEAVAHPRAMWTGSKRVFWPEGIGL